MNFKKKEKRKREQFFSMGLRNIGAKKHFILKNNQITYPICSEEDLHE
jgi:hypothetical protein